MKNDQSITMADTQNIINERLNVPECASVNWEKKIVQALIGDFASGQYKPRAVNGAALDNDKLDEFKLFQTSVLSFEELEARHQQIPVAYDRTYTWVFEEPQGNREWSSFAKWLTGDESLYWITGKPGAGKSTLVKFIRQNERTKRLLGD